MPLGEFNPVSKPKHNRNKPTRKQRGHIYDDVRKQLHERSKGICERCGRARATEAAHTLRRLDIKVRTTVDDLCHVCTECHKHMDSTLGGKVFKQAFRDSAYRKSGRYKEYYM